jgi:hypothetical protein
MRCQAPNYHASKFDNEIAVSRSDAAIFLANRSSAKEDGAPPTILSLTRDKII